jgi:hypothetical protein
MTGCAAWSAALLDPQAPVPAGVVAWNGSDTRQRFNVYRNNVVVSLTNALCDSFPVVMALVGEPFFRAMAREFVRSYPPTSAVLAHYGEGFPAFVAGFEPARTLPYLADVARLEIACLNALHAADAEPLSGAALTALLDAPAVLPARHFELHPSVQLLESPFAIASLWGAHQGAVDIGTVDPYSAERACVLRHDLFVKVLALPAGELRFYGALRAGQPLGDAAAAACAEDPGFSLQAGLEKLLANAAICGVAAG